MYAVVGTNMSGEQGDVLYLCETEREARELLERELLTNDEYCVLSVRALV